jgi:hypothetical protein
MHIGNRTMKSFAVVLSRWGSEGERWQRPAYPVNNVIIFRNVTMNPPMYN